MLQQVDQMLIKYGKLMQTAIQGGVMMQIQILIIQTIYKLKEMALKLLNLHKMQINH